MPRPKKDLQLDEEIAKRYYPAKIAQQRLGMDRDKFNYTMRVKGIKPVPFLGGYGYYKKTDIDQIAAEIDAFLLFGESLDLQYRTATLDDVNAEIELAALNFGTKRAEATREHRTRFIQANPQITHHLYSRGELVASINLVPLAHSAFPEFRTGKRGWLFDVSEIEQFEQGHRLECIIIDCMTTTNAPKDRRFRFASLLLGNLARVTFVDWAHQGIDIMSIDACGGTEDGRRILKRAGFELLGIYGERDIYHLDIDKSDLPLLKDYKAALAAWKNRH